MRKELGLIGSEIRKSERNGKLVEVNTSGIGKREGQKPHADEDAPVVPVLPKSEVDTTVPEIPYREPEAPALITQTKAAESNPGLQAANGSNGKSQICGLDAEVVEQAVQMRAAGKLWPSIWSEVGFKVCRSLDEFKAAVTAAQLLKIPAATETSVPAIQAVTVESKAGDFMVLHKSEGVNVSDSMRLPDFLCEFMLRLAIPACSKEDAEKIYMDFYNALTECTKKYVQFVGITATGVGRVFDRIRIIDQDAIEPW